MNRTLLYSIAAIGVLVGLAVQGREPAESQSRDDSKAVEATPMSDKGESPKSARIKTDAPTKAAPSFDKTDQYEVRHIEGWKILVNKKFQPAEPEVYEKTMKQLSPS